MEDKKIKNTEEFFESDKLNPDELDGVAGGKTQYCVKRRTVKEDGKVVINTVWIWEDRISEEDRKNIIAKREW